MPTPAASTVPPPQPDEVVEEAPPKLSPEEVLARMLGMSSKPVDAEFETLLERSAGISYDPKMKDLSTTLQSHSVQQGDSLTGGGSSASLGRRDSLRTGGRDLVELERGLVQRARAASVGYEARSRMELRRADTSPPGSASPVASPLGAGSGWQHFDKASRQRMDRFDVSLPRTQYRDTTDKYLKRLLVDIDLARDPDRQRHYSHQSRCDHLDKMHCWYFKHTAQKETQKKNPPPYLVYSREEPVAPGSMRVALKQTSPLLATTLHRSSSSPVLPGD